ncbi:uncharacterized protein LOC112241595 isoform X4 [Oncorhynchus tshawytscha]|uniref:uncharacterized protein LOC112241595 isoform X4 n=1 Tax=Oncorhynchus tshawytscha TaxID=74940 RepID=UPI001C3C5CAF|nr:uncharacterized protein LOC112241595 isoform X4 [Oncorhynchus tshawytscha]
MDSSKVVAASEKEQKPAGKESEETPSEPSITSYGMLTPSGEKCRSLETVISRLEMLNLGKKTLDIPALLLTSLEEMNPDELRRFQSYLSSGWMLGFPPIPESQLENTDRQDTVDQMVKSYGPERAVRNTGRILRKMDRDDLAEKLQRDHTRATTWRRDSSDSDKWRRRKEGLVMRRPSMMDVPALLLTGLEELTEEQLKTFQFYLTSVQLLGFPPIPERQLENTDRQDTVDQIVKRYDPEGAVRITLKILKGMNLDDLAEKLERDYIRVLLLTTLQELTEDQLKKFQSSGRMLGFPPIPERQLENTDRQDTVYQMVKSYGPERAVRNTIWILRWMKRHDVAQKLERDHTRATTWWRDSSDSDKWRMRKEGLVMRRPSMLDVPALLLTGLEELTEEQLKIFQFDLSSDQLPGFPPIPESQLENTDRQNTVDQMVKRYGPEGAVRNTLKILRRMNLDDLAEKLERDHTRGEPSGPEEAVEITPEILKKMNWDDLSKKIERERFPEDFEPEDYDQEDNGTYRFQCPSAGLFQCSITGLVFRMEGEGEVLYRTVHWDRRLLSQRGKRPAGPLFMFRCLKGSVSQLHLPHCQMHSGGGCDFLSVAHVTDD